VAGPIPGTKCSSAGSAEVEGAIGAAAAATSGLAGAEADSKAGIWTSVQSLPSSTVRAIKSPTLKGQ
jgi:hypothetical protein